MKFRNMKGAIGEFTTLYDSFGTPIHEGDTVEYYDWCYANDGKLVRKEDESDDDYIKRSVAKGFTAQHRWFNNWSGDCFEMMRPCVGVVKWNPKFATYEPVVNAEEDYNNNCFHYMIMRQKQSDGAYCKVIKRFDEI